MREVFAERGTMGPAVEFDHLLSRLQWDEREIARRKEERTRLWEYRRVDHIPIVIWLTCNPRGLTMRQLLESGEYQLEANLVAVERSLRALPDDYIPWLRPDVGYMTIATVYGCEVFWSEDPNQMPGVVAPIITQMDQVYALPRWNPITRGLMPECLRRIHLFRSVTDGRIPLSGIDLGGPLNTCKDIVDSHVFYTALYDNPGAVHHLLEHITSTMIACYDAIIAACGGMENMTTTDFDPTWAPLPYKGFVSDDVMVHLSPAMWKEFGRPYNSRIFARYGGGLLHNCGPHPPGGEILEHTPAIRGLNCSFRYTRPDFERLGREFAGRGLVFAMFDNGESAEEMLAGFREMMEKMLPGTIAVPVCIIDGESWSDTALTEFYWAMRKIGEEYAAELAWPAE